MAKIRQMWPAVQALSAGSGCGARTQLFYALNAMIGRAQKSADGRAPLKEARFGKVTDATTELDQVTIDRARQLAGLKGYVTSLPASRWTVPRLSLPATTFGGWSSRSA